MLSVYDGASLSELILALLERVAGHKFNRMTT